MPLTSARAILFDLDGVLVDSYDVWFRILNAVADDLGYPAVEPETFHDGWGQGVEADVEHFYPRHTVAQLERLYDAEYPKQLAHLRVAPDVETVFAVLRRRGLASAVITNTPNPLATRVVELSGARPDLVVGGTDVARPKPAPDMVLHASERLGVAVADAWVVGDSRFDRDAARAAGASLVGFGMPGDQRVESLAELAALLEES